MLDNNKTASDNLSNNEIASGNFNQNTLASFEGVFNGLEKSVGLFFPSVRNAMVERYRAETFLKIGSKAQDIIEKLGLEVKPIPPKAALPLFEKMTLEHEPEMYQAWAKLLVASAENYNPIQMQYADILSQIGSKEAKLLKEVYNAQNKCDGINAMNKYEKAISELNHNISLKKSLRSIEDRNNLPRNKIAFSSAVPSFPRLNYKFPYSTEGEEEQFEYGLELVSMNAFKNNAQDINSIILLEKLDLIKYNFRSENKGSGIHLPVWNLLLTPFGYLFVETLGKYKIEDKKCSN